MLRKIRKWVRLRDLRRLRRMVEDLGSIGFNTDDMLYFVSYYSGRRLRKRDLRLFNIEVGLVEKIRPAVLEFVEEKLKEIDKEIEILTNQ